MCEIGCGTGRLALVFAELYPNSAFIATDIDKDCLEIARQTASEKGLPNISFEKQDACNLPADWSDKFSYIFMFDVLHDIPFASKALKEFLRVVKTGCYVTAMEMNVHTNTGLSAKQAHAPNLYGSSLYHCLPVAAFTEGSECLGAVWGREQALELCYKVGFSEVKDICEETDSEYHLLCKK